MRALALTLFAVGLAFPLRGASIQEDFKTDPIARGWRKVGDEGLFRWDSVAQNLQVTWDSSRPNSYFYVPLETILTKHEDFRYGFDLRLEAVAVGMAVGQPYTFELAIGLINRLQATGTNFWRGTAADSPNLLELDYFPDSGFGATLSPTIISSNHQFETSFTFPYELTPGDVFRFALSYSATNQTLTGSVQRNGELASALKPVVIRPAFTDFRLDALAVSSFSDQGSDGSLLAQGRVDQVWFEGPDPPVANLVGRWHQDRWQVTFVGQFEWLYTLERSADWRAWSAVGAAVTGSGIPQSLEDPSPSVGGAFYRIRAERP